MYVCIVDITSLYFIVKDIRHHGFCNLYLMDTKKIEPVSEQGITIFEKIRDPYGQNTIHRLRLPFYNMFANFYAVVSFIFTATCELYSLPPVKIS